MTTKHAILSLIIILSLIPSLVSAYVFEQQIQNVTQTITNVPYYYVDNNTSNVDAADDSGTHSNFTAQQAGPDTSVDLLEEEPENMYSLDMTGGHMLIGDGTSDWGSVAGTISFWVKWDTFGGRPWGQHDEMEFRASGTRLVLDFGVPGNWLTSGTSFIADTWYFVAVTWNETADVLRLYVGNATTLPRLDGERTDWTATVSTVGVTENNFMNSRNGGWPFDGHGEELRYWNISRSLAELQSDYNITLTGLEPGLRSYYPLENDFNDVGIDDNDGAGTGSYTFDTDVAYSGEYQLDLEVQWTRVDYSENNEELCIYAGALGSEDIAVDVWNGSSWQNVFADLTNGWNNVTVTSYLITQIFTIRFKCGTETNDNIQDTWSIDTALLHVWS